MENTPQTYTLSKSPVLIGLSATLGNWVTGKIGGDKSHAKAIHCKSEENTRETNAGVCVSISKPMAVMRKVVTTSGGTMRALISSEGQDKGALLKVLGTTSSFPSLWSI